MKTPDQIAAETASAVAMANRLWIWIAFLSLFLALSLLSNVTLIYNAFWRMPIKAFLWTSDGAAVCEAIPLTEPSVSQARLKDLAASAAVGLNSYDYANWRKLIDNQLTQYFTARGREQYKQALFASGIIEKVVQNYQTVSAVTSDAVNIAVLKKALNTQAAAAATMLEALPQPPQQPALATSGTLGTRLNTIA